MHSRPTELCQLAGVWRGDMPEGGMMAEEKIDGWRACWFPGHDGKPRLWTRNGHPIEGTEHIAWVLSQIEQAAGTALFVDGEFQVGGTLDATKRWCESGWKQGGTAGKFHAFDCLTLGEWQAGGSDRPLIERKARLAALIDQVQQDPAFRWEWRPGSHGRDEGATALTLLTDIWVSDPADAVQETYRVWARDGEGLMLKHAESPYRRNRSADWLKVKRCGPWQKALRNAA